MIFGADSKIWFSATAEYTGGGSASCPRAKTLLASNDTPGRNTVRKIRTTRWELSKLHCITMEYHKWPTCAPAQGLSRAYRARTDIVMGSAWLTHLPGLPIAEASTWEVPFYSIAIQDNRAVLILREP